MNCIVCEKKLEDHAWCSRCVTNGITRQIGYWDRVSNEKLILANAMRMVIKKLEELDDDVLGMTTDDEGVCEWQLKRELELRLENALRQVGL